MQMKEADCVKAPAGDISVTTRRGYIQYYLRDNPSEKSGKYLSKSDAKTIKAHLQKRYDKQALKLIKDEIDIIKNFLNKVDKKVAKNGNVLLQEIYSTYPDEAKEYIQPIDVSDIEYISAWICETYIGKTVSDEVPAFLTDNGEHVRSKTELNIANALHKHGIPYRYECPLTLKNGITIHPDFTILKMPERKVMYWEHRGMMDDIAYARHAVQRIQDYMNNGYCIGKDIIISEETSRTPLGTKDIENIIRAYFN